MLYLNNNGFSGIDYFLNLTLTSVVFEYQMPFKLWMEKLHLTLTSVVFELI